jgi:ketosteroid isomerase-like protein
MLRYIVIFCLVAFPCLASAQNGKDSLTIIQLIKADYKALGENDVEARKRNCTADYQLIEDGELWTMEKEVAYMLSKKDQPLVRADTFRFISVQVKGDMAFAVYDLRSAVTRSGVTKHYHWMESAVMVRSSGTWKIRLIHSTKAKT